MDDEKVKILVIDDRVAFRESLVALLEEQGLGCVPVSEIGAAMIELAAQPFDLVISRMEGSDAGLPELLKQVEEYDPDLPVVSFVPAAGEERAMECVSRGAYDYIMENADRGLILHRVQRALEPRRLQKGILEFQRHLTQMVEERAAETQRLFFGMTQILIRILELKVPYDVGHAVNTAEASRRIAREMRLPADGIHKVYLAALLHDVGMIPLKDFILNKPDCLTDDEYRQVQTHTTLAEVVLRPVVEDLDVLAYIRHHHERYDGGGYPAGLRGEEIPLGSRIIAVAEAYDAMTRDRPYQASMPGHAAIGEIENGAGRQFDPAAVTAFVAVADDVEAILLRPAVNRRS